MITLGEVYVCESVFGTNEVQLQGMFLVRLRTIHLLSSVSLQNH